MFVGYGGGLNQGQIKEKDGERMVAERGEIKRGVRVSERERERDRDTCILNKKRQRWI